MDDFLREDFGKGDEADVAALYEQQQRDQAIARLRMATPAEEPDEDAAGNRYCLDCSDPIPANRVAIVPVRCVVWSAPAGENNSWRDWVAGNRSRDCG